MTDKSINKMSQEVSNNPKIINLYNQIKTDSLASAVLFFSLVSPYLKKIENRDKITKNDYFAYLKRGRKHKNRNKVFEMFSDLQNLKIIEIGPKGDLKINIDKLIDFIEIIGQLEMKKYNGTPIYFDDTEREILRLILNSENFYRFLFFWFNYALDNNNFSLYEPLFFSIYASFLLNIAAIEVLLSLEPIKETVSLDKYVEVTRRKIIPIVMNYWEDIKDKLNREISKVESMLHPSLVKAIKKAPDLPAIITDEFGNLVINYANLYLLDDTKNKELEEQVKKLLKVIREDKKTLKRLRNKLTRVSVANSLMFYYTFLLERMRVIIKKSLKELEEKVKKVKEEFIKEKVEEVGQLQTSKIEEGKT